MGPYTETGNKRQVGYWGEGEEERGSKRANQGR